jgi:hypothetical protein
MAGSRRFRRAARLSPTGAMITEYPLEHLPYGPTTNPSTSRSGPPPRHSTCH